MDSEFGKVSAGGFITDLHNRMEWVGLEFPLQR